MKKFLSVILALGLCAFCFAAGKAGVGALLLPDEEKPVWERSADDLPLEAAVKEGNLELVKALLEQGAEADELHKEVTPLFLASILGHEDIVRALIHEGKATVDMKCVNGATALIQAVFCGKERIVEILIDEGHADVDMEMDDDTGFTALMLASYRGHTGIVQKLVEARADINKTTADGLFSALKMAKLGEHTDIVKFLKENGATR